VFQHGWRGHCGQGDSYQTHGDEDSEQDMCADHVVKLQDQSLSYLQSAWMLGPSQCGPNVLIWRPANDPRNLFNAAAKDILHVSGGGKATERAETGGNEEDANDADEAAEETGSQATAVSSASQHLLPVPVCCLALSFTFGPCEFAPHLKHTAGCSVDAGFGLTSPVRVTA